MFFFELLALADPATSFGCYALCECKELAEPVPPAELTHHVSAALASAPAGATLNETALLEECSHCVTNDMQ